jgi:hypothetical protein
MTDDNCSITGCEKPRAYGRRWHCEMHYMRLRRRGNPDRASTRMAAVKYRAAHWRVAQDRGPAANHRCTDCGQQAVHWSYDHSDPSELMSTTGQPYSLDPACYDPRCAPCHAVFDGTGANQYTAS